MQDNKPKQSRTASRLVQTARRGVTKIGYVLLMGLIAIFAVVAIDGVGGSVSALLRNLADTMQPTAFASDGSLQLPTCAAGEYLSSDGSALTCVAVAPTCQVGEVLTSNGSSVTCTPADPSPWSTSGQDISFSGGNLGIGNPNPSFALDVVAGSGTLNFSGGSLALDRVTGGNCGGSLAVTSNSNPSQGWQIKNSREGCGAIGDLHFIATGGSDHQTAEMRLNRVGDLFITGALSQNSDARLKTNVASIEQGLELVRKLRPVSFEWKRDGQQTLGFIAQDVAQVFPDLVTSAATDDQLLSVNYIALIAPMTRAIQQLADENAALRARLDALETAAVVQPASQIEPVMKLR